MLLQVKLVSESTRSFDKHRLATVWLNGEVAVDFCDTKSFNDLMSKISPGEPSSFVFEDREISGVVWHGLVSEGTGIIGELLKSDKIVFRVYFNDYTMQDVQMSAPQLAALKQDVTSKILAI